LYLDVGVFGIAREAATNIVKHSKATTASITLHATKDLVSLMVVDNGKGMGGSFDNMPAETNATRHAAGGGHGLRGMAERAHLLGGTFEAYDVKNGGFAVVVRIPYQEKEGSTAKDEPSAKATGEEG
jgi:signal transduction histidine kinase